MGWGIGERVKSNKQYIEIFCKIRGLAGFDKKTIYEIASEKRIGVEEVIHSDNMAMSLFFKKYEKTLAPMLTAFAISEMAGTNIP